MSVTASPRPTLMERTALADSMHRAESLKRSNQAMRDRITELRNALKQEQNQSRAAHQDKVYAVKETRQLSEMEQNQRLLQQETKLLEEKAQEIKRIKSELERKRVRELEELNRQRDEAEAQRHRQMQQERIEAENALREEVRKETAAEVEARLGVEISALQRSLIDTEQQLARLERLYDTKCKHDAEKAQQIKDMRQQHLEELDKLRKDNNISLKSEMSEMRQKERELRDLQTELSTIRRTCDRVSAEKNRLEEDLNRYKQAESLNKRTPKKLLPAIGSYDPANNGPDLGVKRKNTSTDAAELRKLKSKNSEQVREIRQLSSRIMELESSVARTSIPKTPVAKASSNTASSGGTSTSNRLDQTQSYDEMTRKIRNLTNQSRRDKQQLKDLQAENFKLKSKNDELTQELQRTRQQLQKAESATRSLRAAKRTQIPTPTKQPAPDKRLERRVTELEKQLIEKNTQLDALRKARLKAEGETKRLETRLEAAESKVIKAETQAAKANQQLETLKEQADSVSAKKSDLSDLKASVRAHENTIKQLNKELLKAQQQYALLARANPSNVNALTDLQAKYDVLRQTIDMGGDMESLMAQNAELSAEINRLRSFTEEHAAGKQYMKELEAEVSQLNFEKQQLEDALEEASRPDSEKIELKQRVDELENDLNAARNKINNEHDLLISHYSQEIEAQNEALDQAILEAKVAHDRISSLQSALLEKETELSELQRENGMLKSKTHQDSKDDLSALERNELVDVTEPTKPDQVTVGQSPNESAKSAVAAARARRDSKLRQDKVQNRDKTSRISDSQYQSNLANHQEEQERLEKERQQREQEEQERLEKERQQREQEEQERLEKEQQQREQEEQERLEKERQQREQEEQERLEKERQQHEQEEQERLEKERQQHEQEEQERLEKEQQQ
eukprot:gene5953-9107_t